MTVASKVWSLWPSIADMAKALNESPRVLIEQRENGEVPHERHDRIIVAKAIYDGLTLSKMDLEAARHRPSVTKQKKERAEKIGEFYKEAGGAKKLAEEIGSTRNVLDLAKSRGHLPRVRKYEIMKVADRIGFELPDVIFDPIR